jgi:GNAT superfamily N-acetyltransferase
VEGSPAAALAVGQLGMTEIAFDGQLTAVLVDGPDEPAKAAAGAALYRYNVERTGRDDRRPIGASLVDRATGEVLGGLWGRTELGVLFLDMAFLADKVRGQSLGGRLLAMIEKEAVRRGCKRALVETSSFQAPGFYERHGYREFGRVQFDLEGEARVFLRKTLA